MTVALAFIFGLVIGGSCGGFVFAVFMKIAAHKPELSETDRLWESAYAVVEANLLQHPNDWVSDGYHLTNADIGMTVWIANRDYGLDVSLIGGGKKASFGGSHSPSDATKKRLWKAANARIAAAVVERFRMDEGASDSGSRAQH